MKKKYLIFIAIIATLLITGAAGFSQDTSKSIRGSHLKKNSDTLNSIANPNNGIVTPGKSPGSPHTEINSNSGTVIPGTTSGTLNSTVNPNTQLIIPLHKSKRKSNSGIARDSGIIIPKQ